MDTLFYLAAAIEVVVGVSLLFAWQRNKHQSFMRKLGVSFFAVAASVCLFTISTDIPVDSPSNLYVIPLLETMSIYYLIDGVLDLIGYRPSKYLALSFILVLLYFMVIVAARVESVTSQLVVALLYLIVGLLATKALKNQSRPHQLIGPLLILLALHPLISISGSSDSIAIQFAVGAILRTMFGFTALYVSLDLASNAARESSERFARLTQYSAQGVVVLTNQMLLYANSTALKIYAVTTVSELEEKLLPSLQHAGSNKNINEKLGLLFLQQLEYIAWDERLHRLDGQLRDLHFFAYKVKWENIAAICVMISDETDQMEIKRQFLHRVTHDAITDLPNRNLLMQKLQESLSIPEKHSPNIYLYLLNIDRFKIFNSVYGFQFGDDIIKSLANTLTQDIGKFTTIFHIAIDEFALVCNEKITPMSQTSFENYLIELLTQPFHIAGNEFYIDVSLGRATFPKDGTTAELLLRACHAALHIAKQSAGTCLVYADHRYEQGSEDMLSLEQALRGAIKRQEIYLCYQPKVDATTHKLVGFEALARWHRPGVGNVSPQLFIQAAETTGLMAELGTLILHLACQQQAIWRDEGLYCVPVAVNVSPLQLLNSQFPDIVMASLAQFALPVSSLTLEITESAAIENLTYTRTQLEKIASLGVTIALDDFGAGFSSLGMLRQLPLNAIKIDKALIDPIVSQEGTSIVTAICQIAAALNLKVVAEGVETLAQAKIAAIAGCDECQGYYFDKPLTVQEAKLRLCMISEPD
jgi:diguanylate cyclase (GGDEF)-like protein